MGDIFFFIKMVVITFVVIVFMQIKIGDHTLELRAKKMITESSLIKPIQEIAHGGVLVVRQAWRQVSGAVGDKFTDALNSDQAPGKRSLGLALERSKKYITEKADQARQLAKKTAEEKVEEFKESEVLEDELLEELQKEGFAP